MEHQPPKFHQYVLNNANQEHETMEKAIMYVNQFLSDTQPSSESGAARNLMILTGYVTASLAAKTDKNTAICHLQGVIDGLRHAENTASKVA